MSYVINVFKVEKLYYFILQPLLIPKVKILLFFGADRQSIHNYHVSVVNANEFINVQNAMDRKRIRFRIKNCYDYVGTHSP